MIKHLKLLLALCFLNVNIFFAQDSPLKNTIGTFQEYAANYPVEKIYLHLDKPYYAAGEYMYFRAYLTDMHISQENIESRIIYVELSDEKRNLIDRTLLYSEENEYAGQMLLYESLPPANYHLRAYTNWMRNEGEEYFYHRDIYIGNTTEPKQTTALKAFDYSVTFFPEGGNLLAGFSNRVSFKALGNDGFSTEVRGNLFDENGKELLQFNSLQFGMGSFNFTPEKGKLYKAVVQSGGITKEFTLPATEEGLSLSVRQDEEFVYLTVRSNMNEPESIYLIGQSRYAVCYASEGIIKDELQISVDKTKFPTGIAQFTLFKDGKPLSERLVFIDRKDDLHVAIIPDKNEYEDRDKANLRIQVTDINGQPIEGSFSLSVTDDKTVRTSFSEQNIKGSLLLDSDLKGYIESPGWYFAGDDPERTLALDNLLCAQGWSRFVWDKLADSPKYKYPVESEFQITGKITNFIGLPVKDASVVLVSNENQPGTVMTDKDGRFGFFGFNCPDTAIFMLQCRDKNEGKTMIGFKLDKQDNQHAKTTMFPLKQRENKQNKAFVEAYIDQAVRQKIIEENFYMIDLPEISVKAKRVPLRETFGISGIRYNSKMLDKPYPLKIIVPDFARFDRSSEAKLTRRGILIMVDGIEISISDFNHNYGLLPANRFESLEIFKSEDGYARYGLRAKAGAVVIKTKQFSGNVIPDASVEMYRPKGYSVRKEFYVPEYDQPEIRQRPAPDLRTTIYWNPTVRTNLLGEAEVSFYTADNTVSYSYILEGIGNGNIAFVKR